MSDAIEFSRPFDLRGITVRPVHIEAEEAEREALARRFSLVSIGRLEAELTIEAEGDRISAKGKMHAKIVQSCAVSGNDLPGEFHEDIALHFVPAETLEVSEPDTEIELEAEDLDEIGYSGSSIDLGEAVAQSLALTINPYAEGPDADAFRRKQGLLEQDSSGPLAEALKGLLKE